MTERRELRAAGAFQPTRVLYWIYAGRLVLCLAMYGSALLLTEVWRSRAPGFISDSAGVIAIIGLGAAALFTPLAYGYSHLRRKGPGLNFLYSQAILDVLLVTGIIHLWGGSQSPLTALGYLLVTTGYALMLPFASAILVALATSFAYFLVIWLGDPTHIDILFLLLIGVFAVVASATSAIGSRLREIGHELRTIEGELKRLRLDTADVLASIPSGVITLDEAGQVAYMNPAGAELLGTEIETWLGRDILPELRLRAPGVADAVRESLTGRLRIRDREAEVFEDGGAPRRTGARRREDEDSAGDPGPAHARAPHERVDTVADGGAGRPRKQPTEVPRIPVAVSTTLFLRSDAPPSLTLLLQDLRTARALEDLRLRAGRLEAVAELSASLAHELKNPLASVRSAVEQLAARAHEDDDDRALARLIVRESERLDGILREFSDFARVDVTQRRPIDVGQVIEDVLDLVRQHPDAQDRATLESTVEGGLHNLWGDPELLYRTLLNLVLNAVQIGGQAGQVHVRVVADSLLPGTMEAGTQLGQPVRIRVIDDGPGIAPEDLSRIFDPFYTRRPGGTGLGLAIAHRAVQAHGGALFATSQPGEGATFIMVLPRRDRQEVDAAAAASRDERRPDPWTADDGEGDGAGGRRAAGEDLSNVIRGPRDELATPRGARPPDLQAGARGTGAR